MAETLKIYIEAKNQDAAQAKLECLFGVEFYNCNSKDDHEERKPRVAPAEVYVTEIPYSDSLLHQVQEELAKERIFNFTRGES